MKITITQDHSFRGEYTETPEFEIIEIDPQMNAEINIYGVHHFASRSKSSLILCFNYSGQEELDIQLQEPFDNASIELEVLDSEGDVEDTLYYDTKMSY